MLARSVFAGAFALLVAGCGSSSTTPSSSQPADGSGQSSTTTITIMVGAVVTPKTITVSPGSQVTFVNNDTKSHEMFSDPHPEHTDCPELDQVGFLAPGQSRQSGNLNTVRSCGFHDHADALNSGLQGTIKIQ